MSQKKTQEVPSSEQATSETLPAIEMIDLCKTFGTFKAVDHLTLTVQQGEIFGLLGPNGSGKTTTINMVSGLSVPTSGAVKVLGYDVRRNARQVRQMLGAVPQETALYEELSAWDNMDFHADLFGIPRKEKKERITRMLELMQLQDRKDWRVSTFSGGMKRRLALGRALLHDPQLIYLDFTLLTSVIFIAWGTLLGTLFKQRQPVIALAFGTSIPLFFLSGAFGPLSFSTPALQVIAKIFPIYYAIVLQQHAFHNFNLNTYGVGTNALILVGYALGLILLTSIVLRRSTVAH